MYYYITTHKSRFFLARAVVAIRTKLSSRSFNEKNKSNTT